MILIIHMICYFLITVHIVGSFAILISSRFASLLTSQNVNLPCSSWRTLWISSPPSLYALDDLTYWVCIPKFHSYLSADTNLWLGIDHFTFTDSNVQLDIAFVFFILPQRFWLMRLRSRVVISVTCFSNPSQRNHDYRRVFWYHLHIRIRSHPRPTKRSLQHWYNTNIVASFLTRVYLLPISSSQLI